MLATRHRPALALTCALLAPAARAADTAATTSPPTGAATAPAEAAPPAADGTRDELLSLHFQTTVAVQAHPAFHADYSGANSLNPDAESATAMVMSVNADLRLWHGADLMFSPELSGGAGISKTLGVAAFPSGIVYRVGNPSPTLYLARLALRQRFDLGGGRVHDESGPNQLAGSHDKNTLTFSVGRLAITDVFDGNAYAHDPTTQFFNWALFASGAWDYPADTRGYTWGLLSDLTVGNYSLRSGIALLPKYGNLLEMEWNIAKARALMLEGQVRYRLGGRPGSARLILFANQARMGSYEQALNDPAANLDVTATRLDGRKKYGLGISADQELTDTLGAFFRASFNDGKNETWAFTEIDRSLAFGLVQNGAPWSRPADDLGAALVLDGLSPWHRRYLAAGGYGFLLGDGALDYGLEVEGDLYYRAQITDALALSGVYQPIINPGYNRDRGPVHVFSARFRAAF
ncbi:MAG TPA: carbohydrate porin [Polyangiaceae bacterium]|nr:carbohydrate porin [Polyangiaceae bacterium]